ncbi:hypothetical protein QZH41_016197 [Actinostola sp. cb2023]|nr:hypothetical protein QZH41_016197 [Actinostola sp. cb2023]
MSKDFPRKILQEKHRNQKAILPDTKSDHFENELFHSPPRNEIINDDDYNDEKYMYPDDSPELFTPYQSTGQQDHWETFADEQEHETIISAASGLIHRPPSQHRYENSFNTPNPLLIPARTPSHADQDGREKLRPTSEIPEQYRSVFSQFPYFNIVQSRVFDEVFYTDKPLVVCAPTGAGKTVIFELAIIRLLMTAGASIQKTRIVYMAPMKALCSERCQDWSSKFGNLGLKCREVTGDSELDDYLELKDTHIVTTTPEKWDSMTRKWKDNRSLVQSVRLFLVDEGNKLGVVITFYNYEITGTYVIALDCFMDWRNRQACIKLQFCSTRKSTQQAANTLIKDARFIENSQHRQRLQQVANSLHDSKLRELVMCGVGYHHAGLDSTDRKNTENAFLNGELPVLFATSTLAVGVNLPAHLVIIKSTHCYQMGVFTEYSETQVLQMIGRAGRPQFDTSATAVIMTTAASKKLTSYSVLKEKYSALLQGTQNIESRIQKNPTHYGIPSGLSKDALEQKLQDLCIQNLNTLEKGTLIKMDDGFDLKPAEPGRLMARYCIAYDTMKEFLSVEGSETLADMLRVSEKRILNGLNKDKNKLTIRFPVNGKIKSTDQKVSCLIQATLGCLAISEFSLNQDVTKIFRSGQRVTRCLVELSMLRNEYKALLNAIVIAKCMKARLWENSKYLSKQIEKVGMLACIERDYITHSHHYIDLLSFFNQGPTLSTMMVNAGLITFKKIEVTNPREIELIVNRHPPFGSQIREAALSFPKFEVSVEQKGRYTYRSSEILLTVTMTNWIKRQSATGSRRTHFCILLIGDADNKVVYRQRLGDAVFSNDGVWSKTIDVRRASASPELSINLVSQDYVGVDVTSTFSPYYSGSYFPSASTPPKPTKAENIRTSTTALYHGKESVFLKPHHQQHQEKPAIIDASTKTYILCISIIKIKFLRRKLEQISYDCEKPRRTARHGHGTNSFEILNHHGHGTAHPCRKQTNSSMGSFLNNLHERTFAMPRTPAQKRLKVPISTTPVSTSQVEKFSSSLKEFSYSHQSPALQWKDTSKLNLHTVTTETPKIDLREEWDEIDLHQKRQLHSVEEIPEYIQDGFLW